jgi:hypothetical protein
MWERATRPLGFCIKPQFVPPATHHPDSYQGMPSGIPQMPQH